VLVPVPSAAFRSPHASGATADPVGVSSGANTLPDAPASARAGPGASEAPPSLVAPVASLLSPGTAGPRAGDPSAGALRPHSSQ
jgi:hypothetical protein